MKKILATPKAKRYAKENQLELDYVKGSGEYGSVRYTDIAQMPVKNKISSVAKKMADYYGLDPTHIKSQNQTIRKEDILKYVDIAEITPLSQKRKTIANNILQSVNNSAQYTLFADLDTTKLMEFYLQKKQELSEKDKRLTYTDVLIAAITKTLMKEKKLNSSLIGDRLYCYNYVNLALAIAHPSGLIAPVIRAVNLMHLEQILDARTDLVERAEKQTLRPDDFDAGTFTLSNLGNSYITHFTPIINYPQSAILGVGKSEQKPQPNDDGSIGWKTVTYFSLTLDHLILDGKDGDDFFQALDLIIQNPYKFIL
jgi:pyruvate dehydrogenase E2 component (dihydrolipoamide acetyltransferase)